MIDETPDHSSHMAQRFEVLDCIRVREGRNLPRRRRPSCFQLGDVGNRLIEDEAHLPTPVAVSALHGDASHLEVGSKVQIARLELGVVAHLSSHLSPQPKLGALSHALLNLDLDLDSDLHLGVGQVAIRRRLRHRSAADGP